MREKIKTPEDMTQLVEMVSEEINGILRTNLYEAGLRTSDIAALRRKKGDLREALKNCGIGDLYAKKYVKQVIKNILVSKLLTDIEMYDRMICFNDFTKLSPRDMFEIIMYMYMSEYGDMALSRIIEWSMAHNNVQLQKLTSVSASDIRELFDEENFFLTAGDKLEIITQRVYSSYKGLGVADDIRDMKIEGVSAGVSGKEMTYNSVWILFKGINIHLSFLDFENERELERVCMNIYRYGSPGQLSKSKGYIVNEMKDHSRIVVVRPPFAESFAFFVRKFDTIEKKDIAELITDEGWEVVAELIRYIIMGCQVCAITGAQGSGKTTLLMSMIGFIPAAYNLRIQEQAFELHLRDIYPDRNILTFRETEYVSGQEGLDVQKKTDGAVNILGEVASNDVAAWMIQMSQVVSLFTLFTHHAKTTENLIKYMRNALIINGNFNNEYIATEQVVDAIRFDIHMEKDFSGHRYVERVSEIVKSCNDASGYEIRDILRFKDGRYVICNGLSKDVMEDMARHMEEEEVKVFYEKYSLSY